MEEAIQSVINQDFDFNNVQLLLIDNQSTDNSREIALKYCNNYNNIIFLSCDKNISNAYNLGLDKAIGEYINFMSSIDVFSKNTFKCIDDLLKNPKFENDDFDVISVPIEYHDITSNHDLNFKFENKNDIIVNLKKDTSYIQTDINSVFIKKNAIKNLRFDENSEFFDVIFINKLLLNKEKYAIVDNVCNYQRERFKQIYDNEIIKIKVLNSFKNFYKELINYSIKKSSNVPKFVQNLFLYYIQDIIEISEIEEVFKNEEDINYFWKEFIEILSYIDNDEISKNKILPKNKKNFLIFVKNEEFHIETKGKQVYLKTKNHLIEKLHDITIWFDIVKLKDGYFNVSGTIASTCDKKFISVEAIKSGSGIKRTFEAKEEEYNNTYRKTTKYLSIPWYFYYSFDIKIPITEKESCSVFFKIIYWENGERISMDSKLNNRYYSNLSKFGNYFVKDNKLVLLKHDVFYIRPHSYIRSAVYEFKTIIKILISKFTFKIIINAVIFRIIHFLMYPLFKNRKIWLFADRRDLSGDNGEHFFNYSMEINDDIHKYFVIEKNCEDYERLKDIYGRHILEFGSFRHKFLYSFCEKFMQSQISPSTNNPFHILSSRIYAGLYTANVYFLQHGVNRYDMSSWITKFDKNLSLILSVSDLDYNEFTSDKYNFDKEVIQTLGYPRFDNLNNENLKKQIVIMPTWRNYIKNSHQLVNSEYYKRFNNLLNNEKLIEHAKNNGYEIILKPHPLMYKFIDTFEVNDYVKIDNVTKHHVILCDSALMITDYSSVAFDFVYLKKPVIYYQYEGGNDHHFDIGTEFVDDDSMEFGEIIKYEDQLIDKIIEYIDNNCEMEEIYKKRVDNFFKYIDKNNSKRVYDWISNH